MRIKYYGNSCFLFKAKDSKLITNPEDEGVKVNLKKVLPDIVVLMHMGEVPKNNYYLINTPGEYEVKDAFVYGYASISEHIEKNDTEIKNLRANQNTYIFPDIRTLEQKTIVLEKEVLVLQKEIEFYKKELQKQPTGK